MYLANSRPKLYRTSAANVVLQPREQKKRHRNQPSDARPRSQRRIGRCTGLQIFQLIERLRIVAVLLYDPDIRVARDYTIHLICRDPALVVVFKRECSATAAPRQIGVELEPD